MAAISVQGVGKFFRRYPSQWARAKEWLFRMPSHEPRWVLRDVTFEASAGSAVGILGANGAGKSTLLKIIARATTPSEGAVLVEGRVAALLELGMGFHPEFTGRSNAITAGQLLGLSIAEVEQALPDIERFADIGDFMDQPLRTYSSGMQMRLAFSIATAVRPDVLIIDEALSVGDAAFQRKCYQRIEDFRAAGTTLLFVSHDIEAVKRLCEEAVFLDKGQVVSQGAVRDVCDAYERVVFGGVSAAAPRKESAQHSIQRAAAQQAYDATLAPTAQQRYGTGEAEIESCWLETLSGETINVVGAGERVRWCFTVRLNQPIHSPVFSMMVKTREGRAVYGTDSSLLDVAAKALPAETPLTVKFEFNAHLVPDEYFLNCGVRREQDGESVFLSRRVDAAILRVSSSDQTSALVGPADLQGELMVTGLGQADDK